MKEGLKNKIYIIVVALIFLGVLLVNDSLHKNIVYSVELREDGFHPNEIIINKGDTIVFTNTTGKEYWPASDLHPTHGTYAEFDPKKPIEPHDTWSFQFNNVGEWGFHDHLNSDFTGMISVRGSDLSGTKTCEGNDGKTRCWLELLKNELEKKGLPKTFDLLEKLYIEEPLVASECHSYTHEIGKYTYKKFRAGIDFELDSKTSYCGYGFYHGFMETLFQATGNLNGAKDFCKYVGEKLRGETTDGEGACYHGIGHGAVDGEDPTTWGNPQKMIEKALSMCLTVAGDDRSLHGKLYRCVSGAYNSIEVLSLDPKYKITEIREDPFLMCPSQKPEYFEACYTNMLPALLALTQDDLLASQKYIEAIPEKIGLAVKEEVSSSLFHEFIRLNLDIREYNKKEGINMCHALQDPYRVNCIKGLSGGHMKYGNPRNAYIQNLDFCASKELLRDEQEACYDSLLSRLKIWYSPSKSKEICESTPVEFQTYCNSL